MTTANRLLLTPSEVLHGAVPELEEYGDEVEEYDDEVGFRVDRVEPPTPVWRVVGADPVLMGFGGCGR